MIYKLQVAQSASVNTDVNMQLLCIVAKYTVICQTLCMVEHQCHGDR